MTILLFPAHKTIVEILPPLCVVSMIIPESALKIDSASITNEGSCLLGITAYDLAASVDVAGCKHSLNSIVPF